jgi:hypothetical protein
MESDGFYSRDCFLNREDYKDSRGQGVEDSSEKLKVLMESLENNHLNP